MILTKSPNMGCQISVFKFNLYTRQYRLAVPALYDDYSFLVVNIAKIH